MQQYNDLIQHILEDGVEQEDRTGVGTLSVFGYQMRFNLQEGFPAITTKKLAWKSVVGELLWFLEGSQDERRLAELTYAKDRTELVGKNTIWTANADIQGKNLGYENHDFYKGLGKIYGHQWRNFDGDDDYKGTDQITWLLNELKTNPQSRRLVLSTFNPNQLSEMALPPCHYTFQFYVRNGKLSGMLTMRSNDVFLGAPFNVASYALLIHIFAKEVGLDVGELVYSIGDAHIYLNHMDQVKEQLSRSEYPLPTLNIDSQFDLVDRLEDDFELNDVNLFTLQNYQHHPAIKGIMAV